MRSILKHHPASSPTIPTTASIPQLPRSATPNPSSSSQPPQNSPSLLANALPFPHPTQSVHFPRHAALCKTYPAHDRATYDRAPIVVLPNSCALPARGCPGRTYEELPIAGASPAPVSQQQARRREGMHPRAMMAMAAGPNGVDPMRPPALVPDVSSSSESDESDGLSSPPPELNPLAPRHRSNKDALSIRSHPQQLNQALESFLPHAGSPPRSPTRGSRDSRESREAREHRRKRSQAQVVIDDSGHFKRDTRSFAATSLDGCLGGF